MFLVAACKFRLRRMRLHAAAMLPTIRHVALLGVTLILPATVSPQTPDGILAESRAVLAQVDGKITHPGLKYPVEILHDRWGIAHIYAQNADDLFFAQGWVAAQDRLFQIDLWRRVGLGQTAEILGPSALPADRFARLIRYRGNIDAEWKSYSPDTKQIATAFTRGINAYIEHLGEKLPIEFQILGYRPAKWHPEDVLARMSGIVMSRNFVQEIARARLVAVVGVDKARQLAPTDPPVDYAPAPGLDLKDITSEILAGYQAAAKAIQFTPTPQKQAPTFFFESPVSASNNWVIDGSLSASGKPMLASDPHRAIAVPSLRYLVHLNAPGWNVIGAGEPALPGIALGHNERIAWGITIVGTDQADIYVEKTDPHDPTRYLVGDRWEKMEIVRERVTVKRAKDPVAMELRFTRHGPVIHQDTKKQLAFALKWAGSEPGGAAYLGGLAVSRAKNRAEFLKSLESWKIPSLNFVYADKDGDIGWVAAGAVPIRQKTHDGLLPVPGWNGQYEWQGYLPVMELPQSFNPERHWLATANHNILPKGYAHEIAYEWAPPHRFLRVQERLSEKKQFTLRDFESIQQDSVSLPGRALNKLVIEQMWSKLASALARWAAWDGNLSKDSPTAAWYALWLQEMNRRFYELPKLDKQTTEALRSLNGISYMLEQLEHATPLWFPTPSTESRDSFALSTLQIAFERGHKLLGANEDKWRWGKLHTVTFHHPLDTLGPDYAKAFNLGPVERPGDGNTPNNTRHDDNFQQIHGASYRHVFDLADWDQGRATSTPGQSGQPGSPHYGDLLPLWAEGQYFPLAYSRRKVEEVAAYRLTLTP